MKTLAQLNIGGRTALLRLNLNVPLHKSKIIDDFRLQAVLPTIDAVADQADRTVIMAHLGRPQGIDPKYSLAPIAKYLKKIYKRRFLFLDDCLGEAVKQAIAQAPRGSIILLENVRFHAGERTNDQHFGRQLAALGDVFINDAFGDSYEAYASVIWPAKLLPSAAGLRLTKEMEALNKVKNSSERPFVLVVGGVKIAEKMGTLKRLGEKADQILVGGGVANTLLAAQGVNVQKSLIQIAELPMAKELLARYSAKLMLPVDAAVVSMKNGAMEKRSLRLARVRELREGEAILDIGPDSLAMYQKTCDQAKVVFWAGPLGYSEWDQTARSSQTLLTMLSEHPNYTVIGGGETASIVSGLSLLEKMDFVSTGGGAALKYLSGESLPGLEVLG